MALELPFDVRIRNRVRFLLAIIGGVALGSAQWERGIEVAFSRLADHVIDGRRFGRPSRANMGLGHGSRGFRPWLFMAAPPGLGAGMNEDTGSP